MLASMPAAAAENERAAWDGLRQGAVVVFRHANAPGVGDPPNMLLGDCATQRNLDPAGRAQARRIGEVFRSRGVQVGAVMTSRWCRATETAELAFPGRVKAEPAFDSFFAEERTIGAERTAAARKIVSQWRGPGTLVVVTHQVNITALTGRFPASGEGVVLKIEDGTARQLGTVAP
jgi:phosphohistidine phosphatase SixA